MSTIYFSINKSVSVGINLFERKSKLITFLTELSGRSKNHTNIMSCISQGPFGRKIAHLNELIE